MRGFLLWKKDVGGMGKTIWEIFPGLGLRFYPGKEDRHVGHASASSLLLFLFMPKMCYAQTVQGKEEKKEKKRFNSEVIALSR